MSDASGLIIFLSNLPRVSLSPGGNQSPRPDELKAGAVAAMQGGLANCAGSGFGRAAVLRASGS
jgi:hypothetical protein